MIGIEDHEETDHPELMEFAGETLGDTLTNLITEIIRLREVILDFSLPMWNYLNSQVHTDAEEYTANAVKSLVKNTSYESLMHLWEDACGYLPDPDCDDTPRNKPVWNREMIE